MGKSLYLVLQRFGEKMGFGEKPAEGASWAGLACLDGEMWMPRSAMDELVEED